MDMKTSVNLMESTVGEIARFNTNAIPVFRKYGIDFYCKSTDSLTIACIAVGCEVSAVLTELEKLLPIVNANQNFNDWSLDSLIDYIIGNHHQYVNKTVPEIVELFNDLSGNPSAQNPDLTKANHLFRLLSNDMKQHMQKEELALFPAIKKLEVAVNDGTHALPVRSLITVVEMEHQTSGIILKQLADLCNRIAAAGIPETTLLTEKLKEFESDLIMHIHVENNVLHQKAFELELCVLV